MSIYMFNEREQSTPTHTTHNAPVRKGSLAVREVEHPLAVENIRVAERENLLTVRFEAQTPHTQRRGVVRSNVVNVDKREREAGDEGLD